MRSFDDGEWCPLGIGGPLWSVLYPDNFDVGSKRLGGGYTGTCLCHHLKFGLLWACSDQWLVWSPTRPLLSMFFCWHNKFLQEVMRIVTWSRSGKRFRLSLVEGVFSATLCCPIKAWPLDKIDEESWSWQWSREKRHQCRRGVDHWPW